MNTWPTTGYSRPVPDASSTTGCRSIGRITVCRSSVWFSRDSIAEPKAPSRSRGQSGWVGLFDCSHSVLVTTTVPSQRGFVWAARPSRAGETARPAQRASGASSCDDGLPRGMTRKQRPHWARIWHWRAGPNPMVLESNEKSDAAGVRPNTTDGQCYRRATAGRPRARPLVGP